VKDTLKGGFWVALGLFILFLAVTGKLNKLPSLWTGIVGWWNSGAAWSSSPIIPSGTGGSSSVGAQAQAITLAPLPYGPALSTMS
jgi:hypothetical protein